MIKLIITDMDGTFLNSNSEFNRPFFQEVNALMKEKGVAFAACTGKQCERVEAIFGADSEDIWILGDSATRMKRNGCYEYESLIPNELGLQIIQKLEEIATDYVIIACTKQAAIVKNSSPEEIVNYYVRGSYQNVDFVEDYQAITDDFVKITIFDPHERSFATKEKLAEFTGQAYIVASEPMWIDISNYGVHKGTTVQALQEKLQVTKAETVAFGDGWNDIELMERADFSFALQNACDPLKEKANYITTRTNNDDAVLKTIKQLLEA